MANRQASDRKEGARIFVVMGVAGCGKSSVASALAERCSGTFLDADDHHPAANKAKMAAGTPLDDADRWPWLAAFGAALARESGPVFGACSALKASYRQAIREAVGEPVHFIHLAGDRERIARRMARRRDHFMPTSLLDSQFATLEPPSDEVDASTVSVHNRFRDVVRDAFRVVRSSR